MKTDGYKNLTLGQLDGIRSMREKCKTIGDFKRLGREIAEKYGLTDREAIDLLNNRS